MACPFFHPAAEEFVDALTKAGWLAALIPEEYGGSGLGLTEASVITDRDTGRSKGFGFVEMSDEQAARTAIDRLNGTVLGDRTITVNQARERQSTGNRGYQGRDRSSNNGYRSDRY